jgi:hypothetical protein
MVPVLHESRLGSGVAASTAELDAAAGPDVGAELDVAAALDVAAGLDVAAEPGPDLFDLAQPETKIAATAQNMNK